MGSKDEIGLQAAQTPRTKSPVCPMKSIRQTGDFIYFL